jgi:hypothetical protein
VRRFLVGHRFTLTDAQRRVLGEIAADMSSPMPMHRLLQGDVGSGKTVVALTALLASIDGGRQGALMAPTEVLAEQHLASLRATSRHLSIHDDAVLGGERPLSIQLLTGRVRAKERQAVLEGLARRLGRHRGGHARAVDRRRALSRPSGPSSSTSSTASASSSARRCATRAAPARTRRPTPTCW